MILQIAIDTPLRRVFDYLPPPTRSQEPPRLGVRVLVPFGRQRLIGILVGLGHSVLAMSGEETMAQVYREMEHPKLRNLEKAGFVKREPNPNDRRSILVRVNPRKLQKVNALYAGIACAPVAP